MKADATALELRELAMPGGSGKVRIFVDDNGAAGTRIYVPMPNHAVNELHALNARGVIDLEVEPIMEDDGRAIEMAWLHAHQDYLQHNYPGNWIAVDGQQVVAHGADLPAVLQLAADAGHPHPFVTLVVGGPLPPFFG